MKAPSPSLAIELCVLTVRNVTSPTTRIPIKLGADVRNAIATIGKTPQTKSPDAPMIDVKTAAIIDAK